MSNINKKPVLTFLIGLPGSGKSTWAETHKNELNAVIHSSDSIRAEFGNINDQSKNNEVFQILFKRVKEDLLNGKNVILDATNLRRKNRLHFMKQIQNVPCEIICMLFATPYEICLKNNKNRERKVPGKVITRMLKNFNIPCKQEGFDDIQIVWYDWEKEGMKFDLLKDINRWCKISHNNPHHSMSIGDHMLAAAGYYLLMWGTSEDVFCMNDNIDDNLYLATLMHDIGKEFTKDFHDSKGNPSEIAHFYQHHCVGSYLSMFYLKDNSFLNGGLDFSVEDILEIALLIELHMYPFLSWKQSERAKEKDRILFGDETIEKTMILHKCDTNAH